VKWYKIVAALIVFLLLLLLGAIAYVDYNQQQLITRLKTELNKNLNGTFSVDKINLTIFREFPNLSVTLENGVITDSVYKQEVFRAGKIYCRLSLLNLLLDKIVVRSIIVENSNIILRQDSSGYMNANIFRFKNSGSSSPGSINFNLEKLKILKVKVSFTDEKRDKHISLVANDLVGNITKPDDVFHILVQGYIHTDSMVFKKNKGSFLVDRDVDVKLKLIFDPNQMKFSILKSPAVCDEQTYMMEGYFAFASKPAYMWLSITDTKVNFNKARAVLSSQIQEKMKDIDVQTPVDVRLLIKGSIEPDVPPQVDASFRLHNGIIKYYGADLTDMNMDGLFMNHIDPSAKNEDFNSELLFDITSLKVNDVPFKLRVTVSDLNTLRVNMTASSTTPLVALNYSIGADTSNYRFNSGSCSLKVSYSGTIHYYMDTIKRNFDDTLNGTLRVDGGTFDYLKRGLHLSDMNTDITFTNNLVDLKSVSCALNGNPISLNGTVTSLRRIVSGEVEKMVGDLHVQSDKFDLTKVLVINKGFKSTAPPAKVSSEQVSKINETIRHITDMLTLNVDVKCNTFLFRKMSATGVTGLITASSRGLELHGFNLNFCNGHLTADGLLNTSSDNDHLLASASIKNVDVKEFLSSMENFDQSAITNENITGKLSAQVSFSSLLDNKYNVQPDSMQGKLHFSLVNGSLLNFEPLVNVGKKVFKNRDFKNITFAEIKDSINIKGKTITFKKMEISSSVLHLFVQGKFTFDGLCDLNLQVPLNNLRRQDLNFEPENIGVDAKAGPSIFLRVHGAKDNIKITLDPAARQRMKKGSI
jgi:hypothetical protein